MSRISRKQTVSPKVYRHFATITVIVTACTAMFADGETTEAVTDRIAAREARNGLLTVESSKVGARHVKVAKLHLRDEKRSYMRFSPEMPEDASNDGSSAYVIGGEIEASRGPLQGPPSGPPGAGSPSPGMGPSGPGPARPRQARTPPRPSAAQMESLLAQSRARSGSSESD